MITPLGGKIAPALRVAPEKAPLGVTNMDVGKGREQDAVSFARRSFGITKLLSSRLDWRFFRRNRAHWITVNRPFLHTTLFSIYFMCSDRPHIIVAIENGHGIMI